MASGGETTPAHGAQGQDASAEERHADFDEQGAQEQDMNWEETLDEAKTDAQHNGQYCRELRILLHLFQLHHYQLQLDQRPPKKKYPRRNLKRPPPSNSFPLGPTAPTTHAPIRPPLAPPTVTPQTMRGASVGTTFRFQDFMPTPRAAGVDALRWPLSHFNPPASASRSSGSSNSTPNK
ncbi:hypothetical protein PIB30_062977 [Stylosanthes scabra]|uniref:Uncharacterized protein n=1 Tax=Stylosanthes scabra TaxID=79078 RepID=A0ABU6YK60_9FABA|nr:hypothetical protein [Stylosanthes scabra]